MSKGSKRRTEDYDKVAANWNAIFKPKGLVEDKLPIPTVELYGKHYYEIPEGCTKEQFQRIYDNLLKNSHEARGEFKLKPEPTAKDRENMEKILNTKYY